MDCLPVARQSEKDFEPLYSSFVKLGYFQPPMSSKEAQFIALQAAGVLAPNDPVMRSSHMDSNADSRTPKRAVSQATRKEGSMMASEAPNRGETGDFANMVTLAGLAV